MKQSTTKQAYEFEQKKKQAKKQAAAFRQQKQGKRDVWQEKEAN